jgi:NAD(P)-dependent dehydrogenase (short-subunit alcohol dehydrogenase family)
MTLNLKGKHDLAPGCAPRIGRAATGRLSQAGASVANCRRPEGGVEQAVIRLRGECAPVQGKVTGKAADVGNEQAVGALFGFLDDELGGLDLPVNNAGVGVFSGLAALGPEEWQAMIGTNLTGVYNTIHNALPRFRAAGGGAIVNVGSLAGKNAFAGGAACNASKFGLCGLSEAVMLDHRYEGVRVSTVFAA